MLQENERVLTLLYAALPWRSAFSSSRDIVNLGQGRTV